VVLVIVSVTFSVPECLVYSKVFKCALIVILILIQLDHRWQIGRLRLSQ